MRSERPKDGELGQGHPGQGPTRLWSSSKLGQWRRGDHARACGRRPGEVPVELVRSAGDRRPGAPREGACHA
eukprot:2856706-Alexandrium_andersonii.AAC.1